MNKVLILILSLLFFTNNIRVACQTNNYTSPPIILGKNDVPIKNKIEIFYGSSYSKTNFLPALEMKSNSSLFLNEWLASQIPNKPFLGKTIGFRYSRLVAEKTYLSLSLRHIEKGQQSPHFFNYYLNNDSSDYSSNYGGMMYEVELITNEIGVLFEKKVKDLSALSFSYIAGISIDIYNDLLIKNFIIEKDTGIKSPGCCTASFYRANENYMNRLKANVKKGHFRFGLLLASNVSYELTRNLDFSIRPEFEFLTKIINKTKEVKGGSVLDGSILLVNVQFSLGVKF